MIRQRFFEDLDRLRDDDLELYLMNLIPADPTRGYVPAYQFQMWLEGASEPVGGIDLRLGEDENLRLYAGQVGYAVDEPFRGRHLAARSLRLLLPLARKHGFRTLWITCNPDNIASRRTCELAGATFEEIVKIPEDHELYERGEREKCRYRLDL